MIVRKGIYSISHFEAFGVGEPSVFAVVVVQAAGQNENW